MATFEGLGIPFPLYEAPVETCPDYVGAGRCSVSGQIEPHCFRLYIGSWVKVVCTGCGKALFLRPSPDPFRPKECRRCGAPTPPPLTDQDSALVSYKILREGLAGYTKDTDYGMISWEQLENGWTHGVPEASFPEVETRTSAEGWVQAKMSPETMAELTRTPNFITWQGAIWLFDHSTPMVYVGEWNALDFERHTPTGISTESFFDEVTRGSGLWKHVNGLCVYVFRSPSSGRFAAYCDRD